MTKEDTNDFSTILGQRIHAPRNGNISHWIDRLGRGSRNKYRGALSHRPGSSNVSI